MQEIRRSLVVTTTIGCKVACSYCPQGKFTRAQRAKQESGGESVRRMLPERFRAYLASVPNSVKVSFAGYAEPFLNPHCTELILYAAQKGHTIAVNTTLVGFPAKDVERLAAIDFESFTLHLPGFIDGLPNENMPVDGAYLESLETLLEAGLPTQLRSHGEATHPDVQALLDAHGLQLQRVGIRAFAGAVDLEKTTRFGEVNVRLNKRHEGKMHTCPRIYQNQLLPDGDVILCCQDWEQRHILGNLGRDQWSDLERSEEMQKIRRGFEDPSIDTLCRVCEDAPLKDSWRERVARRLGRLAGVRDSSGVAPSWLDRPADGRGVK